MDSVLRARILAGLKRDEGLRLTLYQDSEGHPTIGYGHNLEHPITTAAAEGILQDDLRVAEAAVLRAEPWVSTLSGPRQGVLYQMAFNLGIRGLLDFERMWQAVRDQRWDDAAREMLDSVWATQVGERAVRLATQMREDRWL